MLTRFLDNRYSLDASRMPAARPVLDLKASQSYVGPDAGHSHDDAARVAAFFTHRFEGSLEYRPAFGASRTAQRFGTDNLGRFALGADGVVNGHRSFPDCGRWKFPGLAEV